MKTSRQAPVDIIRRVAKELSAATSVHDRTESVVAALRESLKAQAAVVYQRRRVSSGAPMVYSSGLSEELARSMTDPAIQQNRVAGLESWVNVVAVSGRYRESELSGTLYDTIDGLKWAVSFPVSSGSDTVGVFILAWNTHPRLSPEHLDLCETAGALMGVALRQDALIERSSEVATLHERARLARDIHDSVTQSITAAVLNLETADRALDADPAAARHALTIAKQLARESLVDLRRSIWNLRSDLTHSRALADAIDDCAMRLRAAGIACNVEVHGATAAMPGETAEAVRSIAREALSNVLRHSQATSAEVAVIGSPTGITLTVTDDGIGIADVYCEGSFGLVGMQERAQSAGGTLRITSYPQQGTRLEVQLPYGKTT